MISKKILLMGLTLASLALAQAHAEPTYPVKPVTLVVPFPPGGGVDPIARLLSVKLGQQLGQSIVVNNHPGGGGTIGNGVVARAEPDGYTLLVTANTFPIAPHVLPKNIGNQFDVIKDFTPIAMISSSPMLLVANPSLGVRNAVELAELARRQPSLTYATSGNGSPMHIAGEMFNDAAGVALTHSPYRGVGPALNDVLAGHVKVTFLGYASAKPYLDSGRLVALAAAEKKRSSLLPNLPTLEEQGFRDAYVDIWFGIYGPKGMPAELVAKLNREINLALKTPEAAEHFSKRGETIVGGAPSVLADATRTDYERYGLIVEKLHIQAD